MKETIIVVFAWIACGLSAMADNPSENYKPATILARITEYHSTESGSDEDTKAGRSSTTVPLREACEKKDTIGVVAVDPKIVPYGSLVVLPDGRKYVAADTGGAVKSRKASEVLAETLKKQKVIDASTAKTYSKAPVLDFYSDTKVLPQNWTEVLVVKNYDVNFVRLSRAEKEKRFSPAFWREILRDVT